MKDKSFYEAPLAEQIDLGPEGEILSFFVGSGQAQNVETLDSGDIFDGAAW